MDLRTHRFFGGGIARCRVADLARAHGAVQHQVRGGRRLLHLLEALQAAMRLTGGSSQLCLLLCEFLLLLRLLVLTGLNAVEPATQQDAFALVEEHIDTRFSAFWIHGSQGPPEERCPSQSIASARITSKHQARQTEKLVFV